MKNFEKLKLNEKLCLIAILIEDFIDGLDFTYNGVKRVFQPKDIDFNNAYEVSRVLYIMSNFIVNKKSYDVTPKLKNLNKNESVKEFYNYYKKNDFMNKIDILIYVFKFLSDNEELNNLNFIDEIKSEYTFRDLANDIEKYKNNL